MTGRGEKIFPRWVHRLSLEVEVEEDGLRSVPRGGWWDQHRGSMGKKLKPDIQHESYGRMKPEKVELAAFQSQGKIEYQF